MSIARFLGPPSRIKDLCLLISVFYIFYLHLHHHHHHPTLPLHPTTTQTPTPTPTIPTTALRHLLFSIASSSSSLPTRAPYLRLWYKPPSTRAYLFLDRPAPNAEPDPTLPIPIISADTSHFPYSFPRGLRSAIRVARIVKEAVDLNESDIRWFVFGDDDTVFVTENLVSTLAKYDHEKWYYIGANSESYEQNEKYSFDMAFGGGGFAISCSLARVLARVLDSCLMRYPHLYGSDARVFSCLVELGVGLTHEPGFHQVDIRGDLFGMLSAHPLSPLLSLHHFDVVDSIFPGMRRIQALQHLFRAVDVDPARILQQTVCYDGSNSLTVSVAWGYAVQLFQGNELLPNLLPVQRTFRPWKRSRDASSSHYMFNTREYPREPCKRPFAFFLKSVAVDRNTVYTIYARHASANCSRNTAIQNVEHIKVLSQKPDFDAVHVKEPRRQCCDILSSFNKTIVVGIRKCRVDELISMDT